MAIDIGLIAYNAYAARLGHPLAAWSTMDQEHQDSWRAAAVAVLDYIHAEQEQYEKDKAEDNEAFSKDY